MNATNRQGMGESAHCQKYSGKAVGWLCVDIQYYCVLPIPYTYFRLEHAKCRVILLNMQTFSLFFLFLGNPESEIELPLSASGVGSISQ